MEGRVGTGEGVRCDIIADQREVSKFADWAADIEFADYSVWSNAQNARAA
jgi:hypothetical protein